MGDNHRHNNPYHPLCCSRIYCKEHAPKMNKKARLEMETWMKMVISAIVLFVFFWLGMRLYDYAVGTPNEKSIENLGHLASEIKLFTKEVERLERGSMTLPYYVQKDWAVFAYNYVEGQNHPQKCRKKNCLCLNSIEENEPKVCIPVAEVRFKVTEQKLIMNKDEKDIFDVIIMGEKKGDIVVVEITLENKKAIT